MSKFTNRMMHSKYYIQQADDDSFVVFHDVENPRVVLQDLEFAQASKIIGEFAMLHSKFNFQLLKLDLDKNEDHVSN